MALPVIKYNNTSGSNTAASGAGPATALTGTGAYSGDGVGGGTQTVIDLSADTPNLSGVATDGSAALWLSNTAGERHLFRITAVDDTADTVTVHVAPTTAIASGSPVSWAIGGKRKDFENDTTWPDWKDPEAGWTYQFDDDETYAVTVNIVPPLSNSGSEPVTFQRSGDGTNKPVFNIGVTGNIEFFIISTASAYTIIDGIKCTRIVGSWSGCNFVEMTGTGSFTIVRNCEVDGANMGNGLYIHGTLKYLIENTEIYNVENSLYGISITSSRPIGTIRRCSIHGCSAGGISVGATSSFVSITIEDCLIYRNLVGPGINMEALSGAYYRAVVKNNTIYDNTSDGLDITVAPNASASIEIEGNSFAKNGGYGVNAHATTATSKVLVNRNNHYGSGGAANTSGARNNLAAGDGDVSGDPLFANITAGSEDFTPGTGSPLIAAGPVGPTA